MMRMLYLIAILAVGTSFLLRLVKTRSINIIECDDDLFALGSCCDGYLSVGTLDFNFEPSTYYEDNWPSQFFAQIIDIRNRSHTCCFELSSADESKSVVVKPETLELYEFEEEKPVQNVVRVLCE